MFDLKNYDDISPEEVGELMGEMEDSEPELDLDELSEWLELQYGTERKTAAASACIYDHAHAAEPELC